MAKDLRKEKDLKGGKALGGKGGNGSQQGKGGKILGRKGRRSGEKMPTRKGGEKILGRKREKLSGGKGFRGERVGRIYTGKGGKRC